MQEINSHILRISGKSELPEPIELGHNYHISLEGSITSFAVHDNEDGTANKIYTFKPIKIDLLDPLGKTLKLKDTRRKSQLMRSLMMKKWRENNETIDFDEWHDKLYNQMMVDLEETILKIEK